MELPPSASRELLLLIREHLRGIGLEKTLRQLEAEIKLFDEAFFRSLILQNRVEEATRYAESFLDLRQRKSFDLAVALRLFPLAYAVHK